MKKAKLLLGIFISMILLPTMVKAKEYCSVISGNGKDIGSEISCGTEHFYVIENNGTNTKMLSKYNLYVGANYDKIVLDINTTYVKQACVESPYYSSGYTCSYYNTGSKFYFEGEEVASYSEWENKIKEKYNIEHFQWENEAWGVITHNDNSAIISIILEERYVENGNTYQNMTYKIYPLEVNSPEKNGYALQNELARGVTGEKGKANYPIYGTTIMFYHDEYASLGNEFKTGYTNFNLNSNSVVGRYLADYKANLNEKGYNITNSDLISIEEIYDLVFLINRKKLPLSEWYDVLDGNSPIEEDGAEYYKLGDLKEYLSNDYSWLWNTSYWTKTAADYYSNESNQIQPNYVYFVSSAGDICYSTGGCFGGIPRAGIRPVVTMANEDIMYKIKTKTDGNGTIDVINSSLGGKSITFKVSPKKGYKLNSIIITSGSGENIEFSADEMIENEDGTTSINNQFTMPYENVTIEAKWATTLLNPNTKNNISKIIIIVLISFGLSSIVYKKSKKI